MFVSKIIFKYLEIIRNLKKHKFYIYFFFIEIEDAKKNTETTALQSPPPVSGSTTPDYAAGLTNTPSYAPATPQPTVAPIPGNKFVRFRTKFILFET